MASERRADRAVGALLGLACGDAVGTALEFKTPGSFVPIDDMVGGGPFGLTAGEWTDDTSMSLCLAESILDVGALDPADQLRRYVLWRDHGYLSSNGRCFDIGTTTARALSRYEHTGEAAESNPDQGAAANGSLMRLAPVPIRWWHDIALAAERSGESSRTTHASQRPVDACRVLGSLTAALIVGRPAEEVLSADFWQYGHLHPEVEAVARGSWISKEPPAIRGTGYCVDALEASLWAVGGAVDFRDAVLRAANLGHDADTTAAIAGQLAGARWGESGIPLDWRRRVVAAERIRSLALGLFHQDTDRRPEPWPHDALVHAWWGPGVLAGEYPGHRDPARAAEKIGVLLDARVRAFVDLTGPDDGLKPYEDTLADAVTARGLEVRHHRFPIPDLGVVSQDRYDEIVAVIREETRRGSVYVHCWGGVGRTGTVVGCLLADGRCNHEEIIENLAWLRKGTSKAHRPCPETDAQHAALRERYDLALDRNARAAVRTALNNAQVRQDSPEETAERVQAALRGVTKGLRGSDEAVATTQVVLAAALDELERLFADDAGFGETVETYRGECVRYVEHMLDSQVHHREEDRVRWRVVELAREGHPEEASTVALDLLRRTSNDDRAEQDVVLVLDALRLDQAIVDGWDILRERRRKLEAEGRLQITHAVRSWDGALRRIVDEQGPLAAAALYRLNAPFFLEP